MRPVLALAAIGLFLVACRPRSEPHESPRATSASGPAPSAPAPPVPVDAPAPRWAEAAARAPAPLAKRAEAVRKRAATKSTPQIDAALDAAAARPATAEGIAEAAKLIEDESKLPHDRDWTGSGTGPSALRLHEGGIALLADLVQRACAAKPNDAAVLRAIEQIPLPPSFNSGGVDKHQLENKRDALRDAAKGCGGKAKGLGL